MAWRAVTDQMGNRVELQKPPQRIISLVPSQTELLFDLGLADRVVGVTKFCVHPENGRKEKTVVGGTKNFNLEAIAKLQPDLIIGNKEENYPDGIQVLQRNYPVWMSDIATYDEAIDMIAKVSSLTGTERKGQEWVDKIALAFKDLSGLREIQTLYLMWHKPWMAAAKKTFIHAMMDKIGLQNVMGGHERYPEISEETLKKLNPELVLLSTEPFPFTYKHIPEIRDILPNAHIEIVDGEMFSWYGSRLALAPAYFSSLKIRS